MMRRKIVAGNWKLHGSRAENALLLDALISGVPDDRVECVVCPPFPYLQEVGRKLEGSHLWLGAQTVSAEPQGAYTGAVSAAMLLDVGCRLVIVGHSECRANYVEPDTLVARKFAAARSVGLVPILCVGEQLAEREAGRAEEVIARQIEAVVNLTGIAAFAAAVVAYEPIWAVGTGRNASPEQAQSMHAFIRQQLAGRDGNIAAGLQILYGGSVKAGNAREIFQMPDVDGGLIGGASLKAEEFLAIIAAARH
jgi:triosephosphate isomerase